MSGVRLMVLTLLMACLMAAAGQRDFEPIGERDEELPRLPAAERQHVEDWVQELIRSWNGRGLADYLAPSFPERQRLLDAVEEQVPPDARLRLLAVGPMRVVDEERDAQAITRTVRVAVRLQVESSGEDGSLQQREGRQDLLVRWVRELPQ